MIVMKNRDRLSNMATSNPLVTGDEKIAVLGAGGQIGTKLRPLLDELYKDKVIYCDAPGFAENKGMQPLDVCDQEKVATFIKANNVKVVINLAAKLSAAAEEHPEEARRINLFAPLQIMEVCHQQGVRKLMMMSSMAAQEFKPRADDTDDIKKMRELLQKQASTSLISVPSGDYGLAKLAMEMHAQIYNKLGLDVYIPRLAGVLNAHTPWPSNGTTEELDKLVVAAAVHEVYGDKWQEKLGELIQKHHPEAAKKGHYIIDGQYVPEVSKDATFDMIDGKTLPEAVLMAMHRNLRKGEVGPVLNVSEYTISMREAAGIIHQLNENFPVKFAVSEAEGLDAGKEKRAADWPSGQNTQVTEQVIGKYKQRPAEKSIRDAYDRVKNALMQERMAENGVAVATRDERATGRS